jgi:hypothetical protein
LTFEASEAQMNKETGEPAFPTGIITNKHGLIIGGSTGMTLRDYFAAKAMQGMLAENGGGAVTNDKLADWAYNIADALLKAREP